MYIKVPLMIWRRLPVQKAARPLSRALFKAGSSMAARMAMIAITTSNSIRVKKFLGFIMTS